MNLLFQAIKSPVNTLHFLKDKTFSNYWFFMWLVGLGTVYYLIFQEIDIVVSSWITFIISTIFAIPVIWLLASVFALIEYPFLKLFGGQMTLKTLRHTEYISSAPISLALPIFIIWSFISPDTFFLNPGSIAGTIGFLLVTILGMWSFIVMIYVLSAAASISKWRAFFTLVISLIIGIILFVICAIVVFIIIAVLSLIL